MTPSFSTLIDLLAHNAGAHPHRPALIFEGHPHSHAQLHDAVKEQAASLAGLGVRKGDRVLLLAPNRPEVLVLLGAVAWIGAVLVPLNLRLSPAELAQQARDAAPSLVVVDADCESLWGTALPSGLEGAHTWVMPAAKRDTWACVGARAAQSVQRADAPESAVVMLFTAAVDGHARGAVLAQSHLMASAHQTSQRWSLDAQDCWLGVLPLFHAAGIGLTLALLDAGGACVLLSRFDPVAAVAAVAQHRVTVCTTFAPMLTALLDAALGSAPPQSLGSLRICMGLEPPSVIERLNTTYPSAQFWSAYGQAEVSAMVCLGLQSERPGAAGRPLLPTQVRVQDTAGRALPPNAEGEIAVCGPTVFLGYWQPDSKQPYKSADPWHRTGDLGRMDEEGWLWFTGRAAHKQLIKTGGENVYPAEVEQVLLEHPEVVEAYVFGQADGTWGEAVHAICAIQAGSALTEGELKNFIASRIARYKQPKTILFKAPGFQR